MKKFILFIIFYTSFLYAQDPAGVGTLTKDNWINAGGGSYKYFWTPTFVDTTYNQLANTMLIDYNAVKGDTLKTVGGSRLNFEYTRVWIDSTEAVTNGTFDSDTTGWLVQGTIDTLKWVATGGGFTGALYYKESSQSCAVKSSEYPMYEGINYRFTFDLNLTAVGTMSIYMNNGDWIKYFTSTGTYSIDTIITASMTITDGIAFEVHAGGNTIFYLDNVSIYPVADSTAGSNYTINIIESNDSTWYYHDYLVGWKQKDKDTVWVYSDVDSVFTPDWYNITPNTFSFTDIILAELLTEYTSDSIIVSGISSASPITISGTGGTYRKGILGSFTAVAGTVVNGDTIWVKNTSSDECLIGINTTLTVGGVSDIFSITTRPNIPPMFDPSDDFPAYSKGTEINPNTVYASDSIVVTQLLCPLSLSIDGDGNPEYRKGVNGAWTDVDGTVAADDTLWVRLTSSPLYNTAAECTLHVDEGNVDIWLQFSVTTDMEDNIHPPFILTTVDDADTSTVYQTSTVVTGVNVPIAVQVGGSGDYYAYKIHYDGSWATVDGIVELGDTVFVRNISSNIFSGQTVAILTLDGSPASFTINSIACDSLPTLTPSDFVDVTNAELTTPYYADSMIVTGLTGCTPQISITSSGLAQYKIGYCEQEGCWTSDPSTIANGDTVWVVGFSSDEYNTPVFTVLTIGETPVSWTISTMEEPGQMPDGNYITTEDGEYLLLDNDKYLIIDEEPQ